MRHIKKLTDNLKYLINWATCTPGTSPEEISRKILSALWFEKNTNADYIQLVEFTNRRGIAELIHFTHVDNLVSILRYGLIPRLYLENEALRLVIRPVFADNQRVDGVKDANCLSISFPNYRMLYGKSRNQQDRWVVLNLSIEILLQYVALFSESNAACSGRKLGTGVKGIEALFKDEALRHQLRIPDNFTTNPEAEVLQRSVIPPAWIKEVYFYSQGSLDKMTSELNRAHVEGKVDKNYFAPRSDYSHWQVQSASSRYRNG